MYGVLFAAEGSSAETLAAVAREFSPRIEICGDREVLIDLGGLSRLFGSPREIGQELRREAADRGLYVRVAIASTRTTARLVARHRAGLTVVEPGTEASTLAPLPIDLLTSLVEIDVTTLRRWGIRTLGGFVMLPADDVAARLGQAGVAWQRLACGEDPRPLVPSPPEERFEQSLDLEWPIEGLEPLSFVLGRLIEPLSADLERRDRGAAVLHVRLRLVTRERHERSLELPAPMRDARTLRTLALLDLESHPPSAAIDRVTVAVDPTAGRVLQFSLLTRPLPSPEQVSTLIARLDALMGQGRSGSPAEVDSWQPGAFVMRPFVPDPTTAIPTGTPRHRDTEVHFQRNHIGAKAAARPDGVTATATLTGTQRLRGKEENSENSQDFSVSVSRCLGVPVSVDIASNSPQRVIPIVALRRFRLPVAARVRVDNGQPVRVTTDRRGLGGGNVETCAGPWRTSGGWWAGGTGRSEGTEPTPPTQPPWDRDEWDVTLNDGATYRLFRERESDAWFVEGIVD